MLQYVLITLAVIAALVGFTLRVLWWFWTAHEEAQVRERMRQRANGGDGLAWAAMQQRLRDRDIVDRRVGR